MQKDSWKQIGKDFMFYGNLAWAVGFVISLFTNRD